MRKLALLVLAVAALSACEEKHSEMRYRRGHEERADYKSKHQHSGYRLDSSPLKPVPTRVEGDGD